MLRTGDLNSVDRSLFDVEKNGHDRFVNMDISCGIFAWPLARGRGERFGIEELN